MSGFATLLTPAAVSYQLCFTLQISEDPLPTENEDIGADFTNTFAVEVQINHVATRQIPELRLLSSQVIYQHFHVDTIELDFGTGVVQLISVLTIIQCPAFSTVETLELDFVTTAGYQLFSNCCNG